MSELHKKVNQHPRQHCYFCGSEGPIETHHIVPRRHGGSDDDENLVDLCPTCHERLEALYDKRFYKNIGAESIDVVDGSENSEMTTKQEKRKLDKIKDIIDKRADNVGASVPEIYSCVAAEFADMNNEQAKEEIEKLRRKGEVYEPAQDNLRTT